MNTPLDEIGEVQNPLQQLIENLRDGEAINLRDYQHVYQSWTIKKLRDILKAECFQPDEVLKLAQNYWTLSLSPDADNLKFRPAEILREDWNVSPKETLEKLRILQKTA